MDEISGAYPGGPTRRERFGQAESNKAPRAIRSGEDNERRARLRGRDNRLRRRKARAILGVSVTLVLSAAAGIFWGLTSARASDELMEKAEVRINRPEADISREMDRLIDQLWKMEELDRLPRRLRP